MTQSNFNPTNTNDAQATLADYPIHCDAVIHGPNDNCGSDRLLGASQFNMQLGRDNTLRTTSAPDRLLGGMYVLH